MTGFKTELFISLPYHSLSLPLCPLLDLLLNLGIDLLLVNLSCRLTCLALRSLITLHAHSGGAALANLFFGLFPTGCSVIDLVSGDFRSVMLFFLLTVCLV